MENPIVTPTLVSQFEYQIHSEFWRDFDAYSPVQTCETREEWMRRVQGPPTKPVFGVNVFAKMTPIGLLLGHRIGPGGHRWKKSPRVNEAPIRAASTKWTIDESCNGIRFNVETTHPLQSAALDMFRATVPTL